MEVPSNQESEVPSADTSGQNAAQPVKLSKTSLKMTVGQSVRLRLKGAFGKVVWKSSASSLASVSANGLVKGKKAGKLTVTAVWNGRQYRCAVIVNPAKQKIIYAKSTKSGSVTLRWNKIRTAKGYQIRYSAYKNFRKNVKTITVTKYSIYKKMINKLSKGKTYYFQVRSYGTYKGRKYYGAYSNPVKVRIRK